MWYTSGMSLPQVLADTLSQVCAEEYVRFVADWMRDATGLDTEPSLTGDPVVDALVAAAAAHVAFTSTGVVPTWTESAGRSLDALWYPGPNSLFPNAMVHTPLLFRLHGVLIEADSLVSV